MICCNVICYYMVNFIVSNSSISLFWWWGFRERGEVWCEPANFLPSWGCLFWFPQPVKTDQKAGSGWSPPVFKTQSGLSLVWSLSTAGSASMSCLCPLLWIIVETSSLQIICWQDLSSEDNKKVFVKARFINIMLIIRKYLIIEAQWHNTMTSIQCVLELRYLQPVCHDWAFT